MAGHERGRRAVHHQRHSGGAGHHLPGRKGHGRYGLFLVCSVGLCKPAGKGVSHERALHKRHASGAVLCGGPACRRQRHCVQRGRLHRRHRHRGHDPVQIHQHGDRPCAAHLGPGHCGLGGRSVRHRHRPVLCTGHLCQGLYGGQFHREPEPAQGGHGDQQPPGGCEELHSGKAAPQRHGLHRRGRVYRSVRAGVHHRAHPPSGGAAAQPSAPGGPQGLPHHREFLRNCGQGLPGAVSAAGRNNSFKIARYHKQRGRAAPLPMPPGPGKAPGRFPFVFFAGARLPYSKKECLLHAGRPGHWFHHHQMRRAG